MSAILTPAQRAAVLAVGVVGVLIAGLQPQLLGALAVEGRVSESLLGHVATAELLAMGIGAGGAGFVLPITHLRITAALAILAIALLDLLTPGVGGAMLVATRAATGMAERVLIWLAIAIIVRSSHPARVSGIYLATQTLAQFGIATLLGLYVIPMIGARGGFITLAVASVTGLIALPWMPRGYTPLARNPDAGSTRIPVRGVVALLGVKLYLAFVVAVWVYIEPLAAERGIDVATIRAIAPLSLAMQVISAGLAALLAGRLPALLTLIVVGAIKTRPARRDGDDGQRVGVPDRDFGVRLLLAVRVALSTAGGDRGGPLAQRRLVDRRCATPRIEHWAIRGGDDPQRKHGHSGAVARGNVRRRSAGRDTVRYCWPTRESGKHGRYNLPGSLRERRSENGSSSG